MGAWKRMQQRQVEARQGVRDRNLNHRDWGKLPPDERERARMALQERNAAYHYWSVQPIQPGETRHQYAVRRCNTRRRLPPIWWLLAFVIRYATYFLTARMSGTIRSRLFIGIVVVFAVLFVVSAFITSATQTRTAEAVEPTVSARTLPTANAVIAPTPTPVTPPPQSPPGTFGNDQPDKPSTIEGSWIAYSARLHIRFFAPPSLIDAPELNDAESFWLRSPSNVHDYEALSVYRFVGTRGGEFARTWDSEYAAFLKLPNISAPVKTGGPRQQQVGAYQGNFGQFHYNQVDNGLPISGTIWVGQVGNDEAIIIYRCSPDREQYLDVEFAQIIATIDFSAL